MTNTTEAQDALERLSETRDRLLAEIHKSIIGQDEVIEQLLVTLLARGHCLLTGIPGLGKTLLVKTVARSVDLSFKRIQFTPDLMPADVVGSEVVDEVITMKVMLRRQPSEPPPPASTAASQSGLHSPAARASRGC